MHLAIGEEITKRYPVKDKDRFLLGCILPDSAESGNSHWRCPAPGEKQTIDLTGFREKFGEELLTDDLLLGYYLHLVQDILFRKYLQTLPGWSVSARNVHRLHRDYERLNGWLVSEYHLRETAEQLKIQDTSALSSASVRFDIQKLLNSIREDTVSQSRILPGEFSAVNAQEYISFSVDKCLEELDAVRAGRSSVSEMKISWDWGKPRFRTRIKRKLKHILLGR